MRGRVSGLKAQAWSGRRPNGIVGCSLVRRIGGDNGTCSCGGWSRVRFAPDALSGKKYHPSISPFTQLHSASHKSNPTLSTCYLSFPLLHLVPKTMQAEFSVHFSEDWAVILAKSLFRKSTKTKMDMFAQVAELLYTMQRCCSCLSPKLFFLS